MVFDVRFRQPSRRADLQQSRSHPMCVLPYWLSFCDIDALFWDTHAFADPVITCWKLPLFFERLASDPGQGNNQTNPERSVL
jgi:hypothetical protein